MDEKYLDAVFTIAVFPFFLGMVFTIMGLIAWVDSGTYSHFFSFGTAILGGVGGFVGYSLSRYQP